MIQVNSLYPYFMYIQLCITQRKTEEPYIWHSYLEIKNYVHGWRSSQIIGYPVPQTSNYTLIFILNIHAFYILNIHINILFYMVWTSYKLCYLYFPQFYFLIRITCEMHRCSHMYPYFIYFIFSVKHYYLNRNNLLNPFCMISILFVSKLSFFSINGTMLFLTHLWSHVYKSFSESIFAKY